MKIKQQGENSKSSLKKSIKSNFSINCSINEVKCAYSSCCNYVLKIQIRYQPLIYMGIMKKCEKHTVILSMFLYASRLRFHCITYKVILILKDFQYFVGSFFCYSFRTIQLAKIVCSKVVKEWQEGKMRIGQERAH